MNTNTEPDNSTTEAAERTAIREQLTWSAYDPAQLAWAKAQLPRWQRDQEWYVARVIDLLELDMLSPRAVQRLRVALAHWNYSIEHQPHAEHTDWRTTTDTDAR